MIPVSYIVPGTNPVHYGGFQGTVRLDKARKGETEQQKISGVN